MNIRVAYMHKAPANHSWMMRRRNEICRILCHAMQMATIVPSNDIRPAYVDVSFPHRGMLDDTIVQVDLRDWNDADAQRFVNILKKNPKIGMVQLISPTPSVTILV